MIFCVVTKQRIQRHTTMTEKHLDSLLPAHNNYLATRYRLRNRFRFNLLDVEDTCVKIPANYVAITLCQIPGNKIAMGTEEGHLFILDCASLDASLDVAKYRVITGTSYYTSAIWHLCALNYNEVVNMTNIYNIKNKTNQSFTGDRQPSEYGRKNIICYKEKYILFGSHNEVRCFNIESKESRIIASHEKTIRCFEPLDQYRLAVGGDDKKVTIWDLTSNKQIKTLNHEDNVWCIMYMENEKLLTTTYDKRVHLWDLRTGKRSLPPPLLTNVVRSLMYLSQDMFLCTCDNGEMNIMDAHKLEVIKKFTVDDLYGGRNDMLGAELLDDGRLVTVSRNKTLQVWRFVNPCTPSVLFKRLRTCTAFYDCTIVV